MEWTQLFTIALGAILVNNFIGAGGYLRHGPGLRHLLAHQ